MALWAITGSNGFAGLHLARRLLARGADVRGLDLDEVAGAEFESIVGDVRDPRAAAALCRGADVLVHAAAALPIRGQAGEIRSVNVEGTACVLAAASEADVRRVVFVSSAVVYGIPTRVPVSESSPLAPFEPYGRAKVEAERICGSFQARGLQTVVLRPSAIVGPERLGVFGILFSWIREGRGIYTLGPGTNRYQLLAVEDFVDAALAAGGPAGASGIYNVGAIQVGTVRSELEQLVAHAGSASRITALPAAPVRATLRVLDCVGLSPLSAWHYRTADRDVVADVSRAGQELGWTPARSSAEALIGAYDWFVANADARGAPGRTHRVAWDERALGLLRRVS